MYIIFFFFSSRRRHTRSKRDWSSDVCSSDLIGRRRALAQSSPPEPTMSVPVSAASRFSFRAIAESRSEERRVGKECRSRRAREHYKKKSKLVYREDAHTA